MENKTSINHGNGNDANRLLAFVLIQDNVTVVKVNRECDLCGDKVDKYDKFTEEEHCQNCGWS